MCTAQNIRDRAQPEVKPFASKMSKIGPSKKMQTPALKASGSEPEKAQPSHHVHSANQNQRPAEDPK